MFDALFELLFKYRPLVFGEGELAFRGLRSGMVALALLLGGGWLVWRHYTRAAGDLRGVDRVVLGALRCAALAIVALCLFRPVIVLRAVEPQQNFLGVLLDDSRSMQIADRDGQSRSGFVWDAFGTPDARLRAALAQRFALRFFRYAATTDRASDPGALRFEGTRTDIGQALEQTREELTGVPLSGLVVVGDGVDTTDAALADVLAGFRARKLPIFTVGIGRERFERDIQIGRVDAPRRVLKGTSLAVDVVVMQHGFAGATLTLQAEDEGRIVGSREVRFGADGQPATVRLRFTLDEPGPRVLRFRVPPEPGEMVTQNNARDVVIDVRDRREPVLYVEGEPRFEVAFLRRAVADDENLRVVLLQRTADNKFLRLGVEGPDDLLGGFPKTREELFKYRALVLGSVEASFFTADQLRMIADFVNQRGGGLLMLGGRRSFAEGGYAGTPVAEVLPVVLRAPASEREPDFTELSVRATRAGAVHAATQIGEDEEASSRRWESLPPVSTLNRVDEIKPGATTLLQGTTGASRGSRVVLAFQRYGAGKALALPIQDSWMWQMHVDVPLDDMTHETFWRRLLRWLVDDVPDQVLTRAERDVVEPGEAVSVYAAVSDPTYIELNDADLVAEVTSPTGRQSVLPMAWTTARDGEYAARLVPDEEGVYEVEVTAVRDGNLIGMDRLYVRSGPNEREFFDAGMRAPLLRRLAEETGGRFYTEADADALAEDITYMGGGVTTIEERELWDMPVLLLLMVGLVGAEWAYRRQRGLP